MCRTWMRLEPSGFKIFSKETEVGNLNSEDLEELINSEVYTCDKYFLSLNDSKLIDTG